MISTATIAILAGIALVAILAAITLACRKSARAAAEERADRRAHYIKKAVRAEERAAWLRAMGRDNIAVEYERAAAAWRTAAE